MGFRRDFNEVQEGPQFGHMVFMNRTQGSGSQVGTFREHRPRRLDSIVACAVNTSAPRSSHAASASRTVRDGLFPAHSSVLGLACRRSLLVAGPNQCRGTARVGARVHAALQCRRARKHYAYREQLAHLRRSHNAGNLRRCTARAGKRKCQQQQSALDADGGRGW